MRPIAIVLIIFFHRVFFVCSFDRILVSNTSFMILDVQIRMFEMPCVRFPCFAGVLVNICLEYQNTIMYGRRQKFVQKLCHEIEVSLATLMISDHQTAPVYH